MKNVLLIAMIASGVTGAIIWFATGSLWQFIPIGMGLWVCQIARNALDMSETSEPKKGTKPREHHSR